MIPEITCTCDIWKPFLYSITVLMRRKILPGNKSNYFTQSAPYPVLRNAKGDFLIGERCQRLFFLALLLFHQLFFFSTDITEQIPRITVLGFLRRQLPLHRRLENGLSQITCDPHQPFTSSMSLMRASCTSISLSSFSLLSTKRLMVSSGDRMIFSSLG